MILSEQDSGRTIEMKVDEVITVRLKENPTTGYRWISESASGFQQIRDTFEQVGHAVGAGGFHVFEFRITGVGSFALRMKNRREWEGESSILARFIVNIIAR